MATRKPSSAKPKALTKAELVPGARVYVWEGDPGTVINAMGQLSVHWDLDDEIDLILGNRVECGGELIRLFRLDAQKPSPSRSKR